MKRLLKITKKFSPKSQVSSQGFTLVELLVAMVMSGIVITAAGYGLVTIMAADAEAKAETERRIELHRAAEYISEDVRSANTVTDTSSTAPAWAWSSLGSGSPSPVLYVQIPMQIQSVDESGDTITISNHEFFDGNAVMFTGSATSSLGLTENTVYYIVNSDRAAGTFQVASTATGSAISLTAPSGVVTANRLVTYYIRDNTSTWLGEKTVNRSVGPCSTASNCYALVDSIANGGFTATVTASRQANISLTGQLVKNPTNADDYTDPVTALAVARSQ